MTQIPEVTHFFDEQSNTFSYVVKDPHSNACAIVDSVLDIDYPAGRLSYKGADEIIAFVRNNDLKVEWIIETHVHADHLSAAPYIKGKVGGLIGIGENINIVQDTFGKVFNEGTEFQRDGSQFDRLFSDGDSYQIGSLIGHAMHTPGHTPACMTHVIGNSAFVGDTIFMPDSGSARADFPGGDARTLFRSIHRLLSLPEDVVLYMCHDYAPNGRELRHVSTVGEQRRENVHVADAITEEQYVKMREARDATLAMPKLIIPSIQVNMKAGHLPEPESNGQRYLKVPINGL
ncbi:MAG: MBL fold metallo-hydrolase [Limnobacter sp.]|uniref:MBL fold metallo-hydrolase n=1 Tax=Limnobacter sp. TaxID=2003368 RepID=UPI0022CA0CD6|nr:MBL fold metallo-hydrolase [Limnobacter sp.]MCZ8014824.1 MBL fold metallo-hydrolase [Limnobacter sp.]